VPLPLVLKLRGHDGVRPGDTLPILTAERCSEAPGASAATFAAVYRQYFNFVWSTVRRLGVEPESQDDLVQEVFIVIHAKLETLERPDALRSWIYGVVRRTVSTHRRATRSRAGAYPPYAFRAETEIDVASAEPTPLEQTQTHAELALLAHLLDALDEPKREVFALVELQELTVPEAAEALGIPLNTAYSRLRAARQAFDAALTRHEAREKAQREARGVRTR